MRFGYAIIYVPDVTKAVEFYEEAFGLTRRFVHDSGAYAEMETGSTALAFAAEEMAEASDLALRPLRPRDVAAPVSIALVTSEPAAAFAKAVAAQARPVKPPELKPWGQTVAHVRDLNGLLVELCSPISGG